MNDDCSHGVCGKKIADIWGTWWQVTQFIQNVSFSSIQVLFCVESLHKIPLQDDNLPGKYRISTK